MTDGKDPGAGRYEAEALGREASEEARLSIGEARSEGDYGVAWKFARERIAVLIQLGLVETADPEAALTFERIVRIAREADRTE